jgi:hypothetical protein
LFLLNQSTANTVVLAFQENVSLVAPHFLFVLTNDFTSNDVRFIAADVSPSKDRYNEFAITETTDPEALNQLTGIVAVRPAGWWHYKIYQQASSTNLDPSLTGSLVDSGRVKVVGTNDTVYVYTQTATGPSAVFPDSPGVPLDPTGGLTIGLNGLKVTDASATITQNQISAWDQNVINLAEVETDLGEINTTITTMQASQVTDEANIATNTANIASIKINALAYAIAL